MLDLQLPQPFGPGQCGLESIDPAVKIVLGLVEDFLGL
jgi:hypothetical protein